MSFILHIPVVVSFMLLAAHFLRESQILFVVCALSCALVHDFLSHSSTLSSSVMTSIWCPIYFG